MAYNSSAYKGFRITQFILAVVTLLVVGLIGDKNSTPLLIYGIFPPNNKLSDAQKIARGISMFGSFLLYPILSMFISCYILCCTKRCRPHAVTLCFDALGIIIYLVSGVIFVLCIKENKSPITSLVDQFAAYLPDGVPKTVNTVVNKLETLANDGIDSETVTYVMEGCLVYFAIQVICCAVCIYLATVYKKNANRDELQMALLLNEINTSS